MSVAVLIPYRGGDEHRARALEFVRERYAEEHPEWPVVIGTVDEGPWVKAAAVADALRQTNAEILIVADADVWTDGLSRAVAAVRHGKAWAIPHGSVYRLSEDATERYLAGASYKSLPLSEPAYRGVEGGGVVVVRRDVYEECPLDPRFVGWGNGDESWSHALRALFGPPARGRSVLVHLWHPPQQRATRNYGSVESRALRKRYVRAGRDELATRRLVKEAHDALITLEPAADAG